MGPLCTASEGDILDVWWHSMCVALYLVSKRCADTDRAEDYYVLWGYPIDYGAGGVPVFCQ